MYTPSKTAARKRGPEPTGTRLSQAAARVIVTEAEPRAARPRGTISVASPVCSCRRTDIPSTTAQSNPRQLVVDVPSAFPAIGRHDRPAICAVPQEETPSSCTPNGHVTGMGPRTPWAGISAARCQADLGSDHRTCGTGTHCETGTTSTGTTTAPGLTEGLRLVIS